MGARSRRRSRSALRAPRCPPSPWSVHESALVAVVRPPHVRHECGPLDAKQQLLLGNCRLRHRLLAARLAVTPIASMRFTTPLRGVSPFLWMGDDRASW